MSKIKIEQVDNLDEVSKYVIYEDLEPGVMFYFPSNNPQIRIKLSRGYANTASFVYYTDGEAISDKVIPVKAKILWCHEDGE